MFHKSQTISNPFLPARVSCKTHEKFVNFEEKTEITVENTGNIDAYLRVRLVFHWEDSKGNPVARDMDPPKITINGEDWISAGDYTYYYKYPVAPGDTTHNLLAQNAEISIPVETVPDKDYDDNKIVYTYHPVLEILAEAIQSKPDVAVQEAWPAVKVSTVVDAEGKETKSLVPAT
jgi:hypothetical protein